MLKKALLLLTLLCSVLVGVEAETGVLMPKNQISSYCSFTQTDGNFLLTYSGTSFSTTEVNFAAHYWGANPYSQSQWQLGVVIGYVDCPPSSYISGTKTQIDGRVMEVGIDTWGAVILKWISGPLMPASGSGYPGYVVELGNVSLS